mmetsp:Transcript_33570/g.57058  ORF Transcript_33570/g.57058 Transcript_33570/m.57058 type:complete len:348 (+) Transcript_33570:265-1308(+)
MIAQVMMQTRAKKQRLLGGKISECTSCLKSFFLCLFGSVAATIVALLPPTPTPAPTPTPLRYHADLENNRCIEESADRKGGLGTKLFQSIKECCDEMFWFLGDKYNECLRNSLGIVPSAEPSSAPSVEASSVPSAAPSSPPSVLASIPPSKTRSNPPSVSILPSASILPSNAPSVSIPPTASAAPSEVPSVSGAPSVRSPMPSSTYMISVDQRYYTQFFLKENRIMSYIEILFFNGIICQHAQNRFGLKLDEPFIKTNCTTLQQILSYTDQSGYVLQVAYLEWTTRYGYEEKIFYYPNLFRQYMNTNANVIFEDAVYLFEETEQFVNEVGNTDFVPDGVDIVPSMRP